MTMETMQIRMSPRLIKELDNLVKTGMYSNRSDAIRDSVRRLILKDIIGIIKNKTNSVNQIKNIRKELSKQKLNINEINKLAD